MGVKLGTAAHSALKDGKIKLLDIVMQLNEEDISSREWFEQSTKSKFRPMLTILRNQNTPNIKPLLNKGRFFTNVFLNYSTLCSGK